jgi:hypothetical protein
MYTYTPMELLESVVSDPRAHAAPLWDLEVRDGYVQSIRPAANPDAPPQLLLPPLCHPHIHLDKAYILTCNHRHSPALPDYSDLCPSTGSFEEALSYTARAKERYTQGEYRNIYVTYFWAVLSRPANAILVSI